MTVTGAAVLRGTEEAPITAEDRPGAARVADVARHRVGRMQMPLAGERIGGEKDRLGPTVVSVVQRREEVEPPAVVPAGRVGGIAVEQDFLLHPVVGKAAS